MNSSSGSLRFVQIEPMGFNEGLELFPVLLGFPLPWLVMVILCKGWKSPTTCSLRSQESVFHKKIIQQRGKKTLGIQSPCQMMIGVYNHLLSKVFRLHYHSQKVIGSLGKYDKGGEHMLYLLCGAESSSREYFWCRPLSSWKSLKLGYLKFSERCLGWVGWICWCYLWWYFRKHEWFSPKFWLDLFCSQSELNPSHAGTVAV